MARPRASSWMKLKRLARYLLAFPRLLAWSFIASEDSASDVLAVYSDPD